MQKFRIELEQWILAKINMNLLTAGFSCSDPLKPVTKTFVQRVIYSSCERQQVCDIDSQVIEVWVILIVQVDEPDIQVACADIAVEKESEVIVLVRKSYLIAV